MRVRSDALLAGASSLTNPLQLVERGATAAKECHGQGMLPPHGVARSRAIQKSYPGLRCLMIIEAAGPIRKRECHLLRVTASSHLSLEPGVLYVELMR